MNLDNRTVLLPRYVRDFSCIGADCEDSCCVGWSVPVDETTYSKYQRVNDEELKPSLRGDITRNKSNRGKRDYAFITLKENSCCPFLNEEKLCKIQAKLGEDYLSSVCFTYPRVINKIDEGFERSLTLSCPEATRLALLNPAGIEFDHVEETSYTGWSASKQLQTLGVKQQNAQRFFWEIRIYTIEVLQNRSFSLQERLIFLGLFYQELQELISNERVSLIPQLIRRYKEGMTTDQVEELNSNFVLQMQLLQELAEVRIQLGVTSQRYLECYEEFIKGLSYSEEAAIQEVATRYREAYQTYYEPFINEHEYILENYLVNYVFHYLMPFGNYPTVFDEYMMMVVHYSLIKMHLIGIGAYHKGLTVDQTIKLIQSFAKTVEHSQPYLKKVFELLHRNGYAKLPYIVTLIKN
ncbi:flagellin lysine-N-methylase [Ammoniphilus sp. YIM 78166]|uniref:flagellin lysine-N-methylase n=1 Tax=Ammoniphilus sp. YIM 78166 TaxID=1644106 RepID=UPI00106F2EC6|nr:flagellin lysine-N-methylase [Ammoniphilus sp. YIM 78166]